MPGDLSRYYERVCLAAAVQNPLQRVNRQRRPTPVAAAKPLPWFRFVQPLSGPQDNRRTKRERLFTAEVVRRLLDKGLAAEIGDEIHATAAGLAALRGEG